MYVCGVSESVSVSRCVMYVYAREGMFVTSVMCEYVCENVSRSKK